MGKATRWLKGLLGFKTPEPNKKIFASENAHKEKDISELAGEDHDSSKRAIAVATAVAEAAVAAAQVASTVVKLTSGGGGLGKFSTGMNGGNRRGRGFRNREEWAAVTVQSHFRAHLARKALRALKALVKLQALVRGYIVRRQTTYILRRLQALVRAQSRARVRGSLSGEFSMKTPYLGPATPEKSEHVPTARRFKYGQSVLLKKSGSVALHDKSRETFWEQHSVSRSHLSVTDDDKSVKIVEMDRGNSNTTRRLFYSPSSHHKWQSFSTSKCKSPSSGDVKSMSQLDFSHYVDENFEDSNHLSPTFYSTTSSKGGLYTTTPTKSDGTRSCNIDNPNYMAYTQSSKAKVRSLSAPKQRPASFERSCSTKRYYVHGNGDSKMKTTGSGSRGYPGSGLLDRIGLPIRADSTGFSSCSSRWRRR